MKLFPIILMISSFLLLSACQEEKTKQPVKQETPIIEEELEMTLIEDLTKDVLYSWPVQDGEHTVELYLVADGGSTEVMDSTSLFGEEGDKQYIGNLAFYLSDGTQGILQEELEDVTINLDKLPFQISPFGDQTIIKWINPEAANNSTLTMWSYTDGVMQPVTFEGERQLIITGNQVKFIKDHYLQTYIYNNGSDESKGIGWFFTTWQWDATAHDFTTYDTTQFIEDDAYGWESGEYNSKLWQEHEADYISFPHITLTTDFLVSVKEGKLLDPSFRLGDSIDNVLAESPDYLTNDYYEGGIYYAFPGGSSYFYDESTREITFITLDGGLITNDMNSLISILGEPADSGYDDLEDTNYAFFHFGEYRLKVDSTESGKVTGLWLTVQE